tara:strand:- start:79 stop:864 length:786 start_codon:yes stop_codon:yes gene_type:complete
MSNQEKLKVTVTGSGGSRGVPRIGNDWGVCDPSNPKNRRTANALFVEKGDARIIVDCGPDVRQQVNSLGRTIKTISGILLTHIHPDHTCGLYETQAFLQTGSKIPLYTSGECYDYLKQAYPFFFKEAPGYPPAFDVTTIEEGGFEMNGVDIQAVPMDHGNCKTLGFVFDEKVAYLTDTISMPDEWFDKLASMNLEALVIECTGYEPMSCHLHYDKSIEWARRIEAKKTYLTDLRPNSDYEVLKARCPETIEPAYDGLVIEC